MTKKSYTADDIISLDEHTHLLKRLSLTFGSETGNSKAPHSSQKGVAIREILDNSLDEVRSGHGAHVRLRFFADHSIEVADSGRGIPIDSSPDGSGRMVSGLVKSLSIIRSGGKFSEDSDRFTSGLNGVGASSTVHTSRRADVTVYRNKKQYSLSFKDGTPGFFSEDNNPDADFTELTDYTELKITKDTRSPEEKKNYPTGTTIRLWLRDEVFQSDYPYDDQDIINRLKGTAFLVPQLHAEVYNELNQIENPDGTTSPQHEFFHFENGVHDLIELNQKDEQLTPVVHIVTEGSYLERNVPVLGPDGKVSNKDIKRRVPIELAFSYGSKYDHSMHSYVNTIHTKLGGVHEVALDRAMVAAFNERLLSMRGLLTKKDEPPTADDYHEGLTAVLSVQISEPQFTSQSKEQLSGNEARKAITDAITEALRNWIKDPKNSDSLQVIAKKVSSAAKNRQKAREQRDMNRKKTEISSAALPIELVDCEWAGTEAAELYIAEGDSALGSLKAARDGKRCALLAIRGKIINAIKNKPADVLKNGEVQDIIKTLGAGVGNDFDIEKMRYGRVFIAVDADQDGANIACLVYALFWSLFRDVILQGRLYKLETPLFVITTKEGKKSRKLYAKDERERDKMVARLAKSKIKHDVARMKGLGEMNAEDLDRTAIDPESRTITRISADDVEAAATALELIFGDDTNARKEWLDSAEFDEDIIARVE